MKTGQVTWTALLLLLAVHCTTARAGGAEPVRLELLTPSTLPIGLGELREAPIRVRVLRQSDNMPLGGVPVQFFVNAIICLPAPGLSPCTPTPPGLHGAFIPAPGGSPGTIVRISNGQGEVVSPSFRAGTVPGVYELAMVVSMTSGYVSIDGPSVQVLQGGAVAVVFPPDPSPALIPVDGRGGQLALYLLILLGAAWSMRRRL